MILGLQCRQSPLLLTVTIDPCLGFLQFLAELAAVHQESGHHNDSISITPLQNPDYSGYCGYSGAGGLLPARAGGGALGKCKEKKKSLYRTWLL